MRVKEIELFLMNLSVFEKRIVNIFEILGNKKIFIIRLWLFTEYRQEQCRGRMWQQREYYK